MFWMIYLPHDLFTIRCTYHSFPIRKWPSGGVRWWKTTQSFVLETESWRKTGSLVKAGGGNENPWPFQEWPPRGTCSGTGHGEGQMSHQNSCKKRTVGMSWNCWDTLKIESRDTIKRMSRLLFFPSPGSITFLFWTFFFYLGDMNL